jgi:mono/diheme cytochrome c family protein
MGFGMPMTISLLLLFLPVAINAQLDGEKLFKTNCSACHVPTDKKLIGPGLAGVEDRWEDKQVLYSWIKNSADVLASGDAYANTLYEQYNKAPMPAQALNDEQITAILDYIKNPPSTGPVAPTGQLAAAPADAPASIPYWIVILGVVILLFILVSMLRNLKYALLKIKADKEGVLVPVQPSMYGAVCSWINSNKTLFAVMMIVLTVVIAKQGWNWLLNVGIYEGYQPEQPIKFSHKVHAGTQKIDCNYCHSSARNSKTAGIPATNVCMNCHKFIQQGPTYGTTEISKIYAAIGWNPDAQAYSNASEGPVKWTKVHNLPDHAYFNHSQHVTVGEIACQTCHGPVQEMDVVKQFAPLTMGWCINCHRTTKVNMEGNDYYDEIHARMPEAMKEKIMKDGKITASELGGMECAKCHY